MPGSWLGILESDDTIEIFLGLRGWEAHTVFISHKVTVCVPNLNGDPRKKQKQLLVDQLIKCY